MNTQPASNLSQLAQQKNILLLQGPIGTFFHNLAQWLAQQGATVYKINFNAGDELFYPQSSSHTFIYTDTVAQFEAYLSCLFEQYQIDSVVCFGDTRHYHQIAKQVCQNKHKRFWVFEEGYFRPHWITLEEHGANAYSHLPRDAVWFSKQSSYTQRLPTFTPIKGQFYASAFWATCYYWAMWHKKSHYPHYQHHRIENIPYYIKIWIRASFRRIHFALNEVLLARKIKKNQLGRFFIFPLQVNTDSQIRVHSDYATTRDSLLHVLSSFAVHAPDNTSLLIKHHPMDRGVIDYHADIDNFVHQHPKIKGRVYYTYDIAMPHLLRHATAMVTVNSTSGLSALIHGLPVKCLGKAAYDIEGITDSAPLSQFWNKPKKPNSNYFHAYRLYHLYHTQINGSFYRKVYLPDVK